MVCCGFPVLQCSRPVIQSQAGPWLPFCIPTAEQCGEPRRLSFRFPRAYLMDCAATILPCKGHQSIIFFLILLLSMFITLVSGTCIVTQFSRSEVWCYYKLSYMPSLKSQEILLFYLLNTFLICPFLSTFYRHFLNSEILFISCYYFPSFLKLKLDLLI